jgi:general secretion pathway protein H
MVVIAILALVAGTVMLRAGRSGGQSQAKAAVAEVVSLVRGVRSEAIASGREQVLLIDTAGRRLSHGRYGSYVALPAGVDVVATVADGERYGAGSAGVRFFRNGGSTGGVLRFSWQGGADEIRINWLTGRVSIAQAR